MGKTSTAMGFQYFREARLLRSVFVGEARERRRFPHRCVSNAFKTHNDAFKIFAHLLLIVLLFYILITLILHLLVVLSHIRSLFVAHM